MHIPRESPVCLSRARDPQPGNSATGLFLNIAFEPNPIGKVTGSSFSSPGTVLGDDQSPMPRRARLLRQSGMSHRRCHRGCVRGNGCKGEGCDLLVPSEEFGDRRHVSQSYCQPEADICPGTSGARSHTRPPCTGQITPPRAAPALPAAPGGCHHPVIFQLYF